MAWWEILITIFGVISTLFGIFGISAYISERAKQKAKKQFDKEEEAVTAAAKAERDQLVTVIIETIQSEIAPLKQGIEEIKAELALNKAATITSLRITMKQLRDAYKAQGFADTGDMAAWNELYENYKKMGGNFFKAYVDHWKEDVNSLPTEKEENK